MIMMTVPYDFKWSEYDLSYLNSLPYAEKKSYLKKEAIKIRQSLGEAVPTIIFKRRDVYKDKPKEISRNDWLIQHPEIHIRTGYFEQQMNSAKNQLRMINEIYRHNISELTQFIPEETDNIPVSQIHHIFPKNEFPEIMHYPENLIILTPNQHFMFAHPNNNTQIIDIGNQKTLLIAKTYSIRKNLIEENRKIYDFNNLLSVLNIGWNDESVLAIETGNYNDILHSINCHYALA